MPSGSRGTAGCSWTHGRHRRGRRWSPQRYTVSTDPNEVPDARDEFFVGYLRTSPRTARSAIAAAAVFLAIGASVSAAASLLQRAPGDAQSREAELDGILIAEPYGMVRYL